MPKSVLENKIDKATNENNVGEDWGLMMEIVDEINQTNMEKEAIKIFTRKLSDKDPHVINHSITLLNACINNCNRPFKLEVCSRVFVDELRNFVMKKRFPQLSTKMAGMIEKWSEEKDFKTDPALNLVPSLFLELKRAGVEFPVETSAAAKQPSQTMKSQKDALEKKEEEDIALAIQLSLKEAGAAPTSSKSSKSNSSNSNGASSLFGSLMQSTQATAKTYGTDNNKAEKRKLKALYDFEAAEDNEITFKAGDVLLLTDDSDPNWWKGVNLANNEEGLFPSNFVTFDLDTQVVDEISITKKVKFNEKVDVNSYDRNYKLTIDEKKIDDCIELLQNADPTGEIQPDTQEMLELEDQCYMMGPLIDNKLQKIDQKHTVLENLNLKILEAFQVYTNLVKESISKNSNFMYSAGGVATSMTPGGLNNMPPTGNPYLNSIPYAAAPPSTLDSNPAFLANQLNSLATNGNIPYNLPAHNVNNFPQMDPSQQQVIQMAPPAYHGLPGGTANDQMSQQQQQQLGYHVGAPTYQS